MDLFCFSMWLGKVHFPLWLSLWKRD